MNYLAEIKAFYDLVQVKQLSTGQIALWHALMAINNKCAWIEWFTVPNIMLELNTGMSRSGVLKARNSLKQYGLIEFKANGTKATNYKMSTIAKSKQESNQDSTQDSTQVSTQVSKQVSKQVSNTLNKLNETKLNLNNEKEINKRKSFEDVFKEKSISDELKKIMNDFIDMRKTIKKPMTSRALELLIDKVRKMTKDEQEQINILNQSIERGWQTIYPLKEEINGTNRGNTEKPICPSTSGGFKDRSNIFMGKR